MNDASVRLVYAGQHELGEGLLWHDGIQRLFWFSILEGRLFSSDAEGGNAREWRLGERASAAGIIDDETLLIATETGLWRLNLVNGEKTPIVPLEADNPRTRSNDGRTAPDGSFWIGTMGLGAEKEVGAIYRLVGDQVHIVTRRVTIPNSISFAPDGHTAYYSDTPEQRIMRIPLDASGAPNGEPSVLIDMREENLNPDGAVTDSEGNLWVAQWGAGRVACYDPKGGFRGAVSFPTSQVSCPVFGGPDFATLFATTAWEGMDAEERDENAGNTFAASVDARGKPAPRVRL